MKICPLFSFLYEKNQNLQKSAKQTGIFLVVEQKDLNWSYMPSNSEKNDLNK